MSTMSSRQIMPSPSVTEDKRIIEQHSTKAGGDIEAKFIVKVLPDDDLVQLINIQNGKLIQSELTYDTTFALYMALSDALDTLEDGMVPDVPMLLS